MALVLPQKAKKVNTGFSVPKDGVYKVIIQSFEEKVDDFPDFGEGKPNFRRGNKYFNLRLQFENNRQKFERIDYENKEGHSEPNGYNFAVTMRDILFQAEEVPQGLKDQLEKKESLTSTEIFGELVKYKVPIYITYKNIKANNGNIYSNINHYIEPFYELTDEIEEELKKRKVEIVELAHDTNNESYESDDDDYETEDTYEDEEDDY